MIPTCISKNIVISDKTKLKKKTKTITTVAIRNLYFGEAKRALKTKPS